jgi:hypothetical protein
MQCGAGGEWATDIGQVVDARKSAMADAICPVSSTML